MGLHTQSCLVIDDFVSNVVWASGLAKAYVRAILESNVWMLVVAMLKCFSFSFFSCLAFFLDGICNCSLWERIHIWKLTVYQFLCSPICFLVSLTSQVLC